MGIYKATINWRCEGPSFSDGKYSREHFWDFGGGTRIAATASPQIVPAPWSVAENVDPEEAFVAAAASCHMLFFLHFAQRAGHQVVSYSDEAEGVLSRDSEGKTAMTLIRLRPVIEYGGERPGPEAETALHEKAHDACFIANSVKCPIEIGP